MLGYRTSYITLETVKTPWLPDLAQPDLWLPRSERPVPPAISSPVPRSDRNESPSVRSRQAGGLTCRVLPGLTKFPPCMPLPHRHLIPPRRLPSSGVPDSNIQILDVTVWKSVTGPETCRWLRRTAVAQGVPLESRDAAVDIWAIIQA